MAKGAEQRWPQLHGNPEGLFREGSCVWGLTPLLCPPFHALGPSSPVGLETVEDGPKF